MGVEHRRVELVVAGLVEIEAERAIARVLLAALAEGQIKTTPGEVELPEREIARLEGG